jgi:hypothetical protein
VHGVDVLAGVDGEDVLFAAEELEDRIGLLVVEPQALGERFFGVVLPADQLATAYVAPAFFVRSVEDQVVVHAAARAVPPGQYPSPDLVVGQVEVDDPVDVVALEEELGLPAIARKSIDDEPVVPVVLRQPFADHALDLFVRHEFTRRHGAAYLSAQLGVMLHMPAEDVTDADVYEIEVPGQQRALSPLATTLRPNDHVLLHGSTLAEVRVTMGPVPLPPAPAHRIPVGHPVFICPAHRPCIDACKYRCRMNQ